MTDSILESHSSSQRESLVQRLGTVSPEDMASLVPTPLGLLDCQEGLEGPKGVMITMIGICRDAPIECLDKCPRVG
jgi:hypothetical protein